MGIDAIHSFHPKCTQNASAFCIILLCQCKHTVQGRAGWGTGWSFLNFTKLTRHSLRLTPSCWKSMLWFQLTNNVIMGLWYCWSKYWQHRCYTTNWSCCCSVPRPWTVLDLRIGRSCDSSSTTPPSSEPPTGAAGWSTVGQPTNLYKSNKFFAFSPQFPFYSETWLCHKDIHPVSHHLLLSAALRFGQEMYRKQRPT